MEVKWEAILHLARYLNTFEEKANPDQVTHFQHAISRYRLYRFPLLQVIKSLNSFSDAKLSLEHSVWRLYEVNDAFV